MLDPRESRFWQATLLSGLMDGQGLTACWQAISPEKRDDLENLDRRLARQAIQSKALTIWQAQQLLAGRSSGYKVDRYILQDLIGQGGMGRVYLAHDTRLHRQVALKILSPERVNNPRAVARFRREARVGAQLQHENLVRIYDFGECNGRFFLVMEYIDGKTIGTLISEHGQLTPATAASLTQQVAQGLEHAYLKGLIHRDVNPYNILVTRDGTAKLADLGLAIDLSEHDHVTREGATVGTFDYVAPEQARHSHAVDIRSDIYALGCSIYHMCTGQVPFPSSSLPEKLFAHQVSEPQPINQIVPGFPEGLAAVIYRMMRKSPDERYATPMEVVQALEPYTEERTSSAMTQTGSVSDRSEAAPLAVTETGSAGSSGELKPMSPSLATDHDRSDAEFPLFVDLGPEPLLSEGLSRPKPRSTLDHTTSSSSTVPRLRRLTSLRLWGLALLTTTLMALVGVLAVVGPSGASLRGTASDLNAKSRTTLTSTSKSQQAASVPSTEPEILVRAEGEIEQAFPAEKLFEAMQTAMGVHGRVELQNREPIHLSGNQMLNFKSGRGRLCVQAVPGFQPVLEIELDGLKPVLTTGSGVALELSGVTFKVSYPQKAARTLPAVIEAAGSAKVDRCAFQLTGRHSPKGSRALFSNGGVLEVNRSWFQGFDEAIGVIAMNRTPARIRQTMIVPVVRLAQNQARAPDWYGWGVKLQLGAGGGTTKKNSQPHLILDHCTVEQAGLINLTNPLVPSVLHVEVTGCAVKAEALLACNRSSALSSQIQWRGTGNQYDILGRIWIVFSAKEGTPAFSSAVTDLQSWLHFAPGDRNPIQEKLKFLIDPKGPTELAQPYDFKIQAPVAPQVRRPGADPDLVGPWSNG